MEVTEKQCFKDGREERGEGREKKMQSKNTLKEKSLNKQTLLTIAIPKQW